MKQQSIVIQCYLLQCTYSRDIFGRKMLEDIKQIYLPTFFSGICFLKLASNDVFLGWRQMIAIAFRKYKDFLKQVYIRIKNYKNKSFRRVDIQIKVQVNRSGYLFCDCFNKTAPSLQCRGFNYKIKNKLCSRQKF